MIYEGLEGSAFDFEAAKIRQTDQALIELETVCLAMKLELSPDGRPGVLRAAYDGLAKAALTLRMAREAQDRVESEETVGMEGPGGATRPGSGCY